MRGGYYVDLLDGINLYDRDWVKIKEDDAFTDIVQGWFDVAGEKYFKHMRKRDIVVQAGGYCGVFPRLFAEQVGVVYTFEPDPLNFFCLTLNCQSDNIIKTQGALGNERGMVSVNRAVSNNKGMNNVFVHPHSAIPTHCIDDLRLKDCDMIQLDIEGYEYNVLLGAEETIKTHRPVISVEDTNSSIEEFLGRFGYRACDTAFRDTIYKCV